MNNTNNTNNNLSIPEDISGFDFSKWTFYTKDEYEEILFNEKIYEIDYILKYNYENFIDNSDYLSELKKENLDLSFLKDTLIFMISR